VPTTIQSAPTQVGLHRDARGRDPVRFLAQTPVDHLAALLDVEVGDRYVIGHHARNRKLERVKQMQLGPERFRPCARGVQGRCRAVREVGGGE
jgi:hypothetical protein